MSAAFGPSHDGFNAALYMNGGRAIVEDGVIGSRFGAVSRTASGDRIVYAHHPPLIYVADAAASVATRGELSARVPAIAASYIVLPLLALLLAACGLPSGSAAVGLFTAFATPMFLMFGAMTEPHVLGLAPMTALVLLWHRHRHGARVPAWAFAAAGAIASLTSWQAALCAGVIGLTMLLLDRRRPAGLAVLGGCGVAAVLVGSWILWAYDGDARDFVARATHRFGVGSGLVTFRQAARQQADFLNDLFPVGGWLMVPIAAVGLFDHRTRAVVAVSLGSVLGYAALFRNGAYDHNYWLFGLLLPLTLGAAVTAERIARWLSHFPWLRHAPAPIALVFIALLAAAISQPSDEETHRRAAREIGAQVRGIVWPPSQRHAFHAFGDLGRTDLLPWLLFYSRREPFGVDGSGSVPREQLVLTIVDGRLVAQPGEHVIDR